MSRCVSHQQSHHTAKLPLALNSYPRAHLQAVSACGLLARLGDWSTDHKLDPEPNAEWSSLIVGYPAPVSGLQVKS